MPQNQYPESQFIKRVMPDASPEERADATKRWFGFLRTLDRIVMRLEKETPHHLPAQKRTSGPEDSSSTIPLL